VDTLIANYGIILLPVAVVVSVLVNYWIIRLAVFHGMRMHTEWTQNLRR
jgi:hypothetical protein